MGALGYSGTGRWDMRARRVHLILLLCLFFCQPIIPTQYTMTSIRDWNACPAFVHFKSRSERRHHGLVKIFLVISHSNQDLVPAKDV